MNNFKNLNQEKISQFEKNQAPLVERKIKSNLNFFQFLGNLIELFLPKQAQIYGKMLEEDKNILMLVEALLINWFNNPNIHHKQKTNPSN